MHPRTHEVLSYLDSCRSELRDAVHAIPVDDRSVRPASDRWSVAEVLEHLFLIESPLERFLSSTWIGQVRAGALGLEDAITPVMPSFEAHRRMFVDHTRGSVAPGGFQPHGFVEATAAWRLLEDTRNKLRATLLSADGLAWGKTTITYPGVSHRPKNLYHWVLWLGSHEARHTAQIREIALEMSMPLRLRH